MEYIIYIYRISFIDGNFRYLIVLIDMTKEKIMHYEPFFKLFKKIAERETRVITFLTNEKIPIGSYAFVPSYCADKQCDCRRALVSVYEDKKEAYSKQPLATISYGWEDFKFYRDWSGGFEDKMIQEFKGPALDSMQPQSQYAPFLLATFIDLIEKDEDYAQRLQRHYAFFKYKKGMRMPSKLRALMNPLTPCACQSGKIFKLCCGKNRSRLRKGKRR